MTSYPRYGCRIAPSLMSAELAVPVKAVDVQGNERVMLLSELDGSIWQQFSRETVQALARQVIARVTASITMAMASDHRKHQGMFILKPPPLPAGKTLMDLDLEESTIATLQKEGLFNDPETFAAMTVRDLTMIPRFGSRRLVDLLTAMEECVGRYGDRAPLASQDAVQPWLERLQAQPDADRIQARDPRIGWQIRALDRQARDMADLLARLDQSSLPAADLGSRLKALNQTLEGMKRMTLADELSMTLLNSGIKPRHAQMLLRLRGWDGVGLATLQSVGDEFGLTRERVRQITTLAEEQLRGAPVYLPRLEAAVDRMLSMLPATADDIEAAFIQAGLASSNFRVEGVLSAAQAFDIPADAAVTVFHHHRLVVPARLLQLADVAWGTALRHIEQWGADRLNHVASDVSSRLGQVVTPEAVTRILALAPGFSRLEAEGGWYWLGESRRSRLHAHIEKIFCVCEEIPVAELLDGIIRGCRTEEAVIPRRILLELCRQSGWLEVNHWNMVRRLRRPDAARVLSASEQTIFQILEANGRVMSWGELKNRCTDAGMVKVTFDVTVMNSPIFKKIAKGTYAIRGTEITTETLAGCQNRTSGFRPTRAKPQVGELPDGRVFIVFRVTEYLLKSGLVFIPSCFRGRITHGRFEMIDALGRNRGRLACYNGSNLYGLRRYLQEEGLTLDAAFCLTFDLKARKVVFTHQSDHEVPVSSQALGVVGAS